jgi:hypothetical protein
MPVTASKPKKIDVSRAGGTKGVERMPTKALGQFTSSATAGSRT